MPQTEPRAQDDPGFTPPAVAIDELPTPIQDWADPIDAQIQQGIERAIEPFTQLSEQIAVVQQSIDALSEVEQARVERRSILISLWVVFIGVLWIQIIHPNLQGTAQGIQTISEQLQTRVTGEEALKHQKCIRLEFPSTGSMTSDFGERQSPGGIGSTDHKGIDLAGGEGTPITAAAAGKVIHAGNAGDGYGNSIVLSHGSVDGHAIETLYGHLSQIKVKAGDRVSPVQVIGAEGNTGISTGSHLHFGVKINGQWVDPAEFLAQDFCPGGGK